MVKLNTVVVMMNEDKPEVFANIRTRRDLQQRLGVELRSRNEDHRRWQVADPSAVGSLRDLDEVSTAIGTGYHLFMGLERTGSGNAKQRRKLRRSPEPRWNFYGR